MAKKKPKKKAPARVVLPARATVTVDLGDDVLWMLDDLCARLQKVSLSPRRITRSAAIREAILCLSQKNLTAGNGHSEGE